MKSEKWVYQIHPDLTASPRECTQFFRLPDITFITSFGRYFYPEPFLQIVDFRIAESQSTEVDGYDKDKFMINGFLVPQDLLSALYSIQEEGVTYRLLDFIPEMKIAIASIQPEYKEKSLMIFRLGKYENRVMLEGQYPDITILHSSHEGDAFSILLSTSQTQTDFKLLTFSSLDIKSAKVTDYYTASDPVA